jgi:hypothetical protein
MLKKELLDLLACPRCRGALDYDKRANKLICRKCRLRYNIMKNDIPDMIIEDAERF